MPLTVKSNSNKNKIRTTVLTRPIQCHSISNWYIDMDDISNIDYWIITTSTALISKHVLFALWLLMCRLRPIVTVYRRASARVIATSARYIARSSNVYDHMGTSLTTVEMAGQQNVWTEDPEVTSFANRRRIAAPSEHDGRRRPSNHQLQRRAQCWLPSGEPACKMIHHADDSTPASPINARMSKHHHYRQFRSAIWLTRNYYRLLCAS